MTTIHTMCRRRRAAHSRRMRSWRFDHLPCSPRSRLIDERRWTAADPDHARVLVHRVANRSPRWTRPRLVRASRPRAGG